MKCILCGKPDPFLSTCVVGDKCICLHCGDKLQADDFMVITRDRYDKLMAYQNFLKMVKSTLEEVK